MESCSCICVEPDSYATFLKEKVRKAIKAHRCGECGADIKPGEQYEVVKGVWDGHWQTHKTCMTCVRIRGDIFVCGWIYGSMWEAIHECVCGFAKEGECVCPE